MENIKNEYAKQGYTYREDDPVIILSNKLEQGISDIIDLIEAQPLNKISCLDKCTKDSSELIKNPDKISANIEKLITAHWDELSLFKIKTKQNFRLINVFLGFSIATLIIIIMLLFTNQSKAQSIALTAFATSESDQSGVGVITSASPFNYPTTVAIRGSRNHTKISFGALGKISSNAYLEINLKTNFSQSPSPLILEKHHIGAAYFLDQIKFGIGIGYIEIHSQVENSKYGYTTLRLDSTNWGTNIIVETGEKTSAEIGKLFNITKNIDLHTSIKTELDKRHQLNAELFFTL